ncbi:hypothetical protein NDU88_000514, partial [Pleurodeles waltl]
IILRGAVVMIVLYGVFFGMSEWGQEGPKASCSEVTDREHQSTPLLHQPENVCTYLAQTVLNRLDFCMMNKKSTTDVVSTCLVTIPTPDSVLLQVFNDTNKEEAVEESGVLTNFSPYEYCRFCQETTDDRLNNLIQ